MSTRLLITEINNCEIKSPVNPYISRCPHLNDGIIACTCMIDGHEFRVDKTLSIRTAIMQLFDKCPLPKVIETE